MTSKSVANSHQENTYLSQALADVAIASSTVNHCAVEGTPVEAVVEKVVQVSVHLSETSHGFGKASGFGGVVLVELKDANAVAGHEGVEVLVAFVWVSLEGDVAVGGGLEHLIEAVVNHGAEFLILLHEKGGVAVGDDPWLVLLEDTIGHQLADDAPCAVRVETGLFSKLIDGDASMRRDELEEFKVQGNLPMLDVAAGDSGRHIPERDQDHSRCSRTLSAISGDRQ